MKIVAEREDVLAGAAPARGRGVGEGYVTLVRGRADVHSAMRRRREGYVC